MSSLTDLTGCERDRLAKLAQRDDVQLRRVAHMSLADYLSEQGYDVQIGKPVTIQRRERAQVIDFGRGASAPRRDPARWWAALWLRLEQPAVVLGALGFVLCFWVGLWQVMNWLQGVLR